MNSIKSNDEFDKIVNELFLKHGYRLVKVGSGNFVVNSIRFNPRFIQEDPDQSSELEKNLKVLNYRSEKCTICLEAIPDANVIEEMVLDGFLNKEAGIEMVSYYDGESIIIVNNYASLLKSLRIMKA